ncbi:MAG: hypothetical protein ACRDOK_30905 [Streptosporangiaceae bacterium]
MPKFREARLTCPLFITTAEFLPGHRRQLQATRKLIGKAEAAGQPRVAQMNRAVETSLLSIISALDHTLDRTGCSTGCTCHDGDAGHAG